jgi:nitroreductase
MDAIEAIQRRTSVRRYRSDPVPRPVIEQLLDCAVRAPNHKLTEPWRFAVLTGQAKATLAEIRARHRLKRYQDPASAEAQAGMDKVRRETLEVPAVIVVMSRVHEDEVTREEDFAAVMMATANMMTAAQSLGLGTYLKTGGVMRDPSLIRLVGLPDGYRIVGLLSVGYPADPESPRRRRPACELTEWLG